MILLPLLRAHLSVFVLSNYPFDVTHKCHAKKRDEGVQEKGTSENGVGFQSVSSWRMC